MDLLPDARYRRPGPSLLRLRSFANPDLGSNGFAGPQLMVVVGARVENNLHGDALHDLHVISRSILRRQEAKAGSTRARDAVYLAIVLSSVGVKFDRDSLSGAHVTQLSFFEVGGNPDVVKIDDLHEFLAWSYILANFDGAIADDAAHGRNDLCVLQVQTSLVEIGFLALGFGKRGRCFGARHLHLPGSRVRIRPVGLCLHELALSLRDLL